MKANFQAVCQRTPASRTVRPLGAIGLQKTFGFAHEGTFSRHAIRLGSIGGLPPRPSKKLTVIGGQSQGGKITASDQELARSDGVEEKCKRAGGPIGCLGAGG